MSTKDGRQVIIGGRDLTEHIQSVVAQAPPLSAQQIAALRGLLAPPNADGEQSRAPHNPAKPKQSVRRTNTSRADSSRMTDADFIAAIVKRAPELTDKQIAGLRDLIVPVQRDIRPLVVDAQPTLPSRPQPGKPEKRDEPVADEPEPEPIPVALYRHFDEDGVVLYVGITDNPEARAKQHQASAWMTWAMSSRIEWFPDRRAALDAERLAIKAERPLFNERSNNYRHDGRLVEYLVKRGRLDLLVPLRNLNA